jgi:hypothetical protein
LTENQKIVKETTETLSLAQNDNSSQETPSKKQTHKEHNVSSPISQESTPSKIETQEK